MLEGQCSWWHLHVAPDGEALVKFRLFLHGSALSVVASVQNALGLESTSEPYRQHHKLFCIVLTSVSYQQDGRHEFKHYTFKRHNIATAEHSAKHALLDQNGRCDHMTT